MRFFCSLGSRCQLFHKVKSIFFKMETKMKSKRITSENYCSGAIELKI